MSKFQDPVFLASDQYKDAGNLNARIQLHERYSTNPYGWFRWVFDQIELPPQAYILEVGCGSGKLWSENLERIPPMWKVILSDFSQGMVNGCLTRLAGEHNQFGFCVSDAMTIPFPEATFETVVADHMLYHVPERKRALAEIARVLKSHGTLYAATNGEKHLLELDQLLEQYYSSTEEGLYQGKFNKSFTLENGATQLTPWFNQVEVRRYEDWLVVTQAEPLLAYIYSMIPRWGIKAGTGEEVMLEQAIHDTISREGCLRIQKSSGLFMAKK